MKQHILLIDDDKDELSIFMDALLLVPHDDGFKCTYAHSATRATEMLKLLVPDFIFVDFNMPGQNGLDFIAFTTRQPHLKNTKLCLYSTNIDEQTKKIAEDFGARCIKKPLTIKELAESLSELLVSEPQPAYSSSAGGDYWEAAYL
jgi:CheY-like chemotaxis protein